LSSNGSYSSGYNGATTGYFLGGVPAVASASTSEWTVQRTSVFPINSYYPAAQYPRPYPPNPGWMPGFGNKQTPTKSQPTDQLQPADLQSAAIEQAHDARPRFDTSRQLDTSIQSDQSIQPVSFAVALPLAEHSPDMAVGDRLFREGKYAEAYLCYLAAQRDIGQHSEIYLRQAFALVAMQKYSHAVAKLKRGFQVEPDAFDRIATFQEAFGADADHADFRAKKREWLEHVSGPRLIRAIAKGSF
jgi:tetratricopeptide (TPR) repeat protein